MGRPPKRIPVIGDEFGEWTVIGTPIDDGRVSKGMWPCRCSCGEIRNVTGHNLLAGGSKSCGHAAREAFVKRRELKSKQRLSRLTWKLLIAKADRGEVTLDSNWRSFERFFADLGERLPRFVLSRRDLDGVYSATNCFWEERGEQMKRLQIRLRGDVPVVKDASMKHCPRCKQEKLRDEFYVNKVTKDKRHSHCKKCMREEIRAFDFANPAKAMIDRARARARKKGFAFALRPEDLEPLPTHCPVFGFVLTRGNGQQDPTAYSLDRIDNKKGYVPGNVVVMSYLANRLKNDGTAAQHTRIAEWMFLMETSMVTRLLKTAGISMGLL